MVVDAGAGILVVAVLTTLAVTGAIVFVKGPGLCARKRRRSSSKPRKCPGARADKYCDKPRWSSQRDQAPDAPYPLNASGPPFKYSEEAQFKLPEEPPEPEEEQQQQQQQLPEEPPYPAFPEYSISTPSERQSFRRTPAWSQSL